MAVRQGVPDRNSDTFTCHIFLHKLRLKEGSDGVGDIAEETAGPAVGRASDDARGLGGFVTNDKHLLVLREGLADRQFRLAPARAPAGTDHVSGPSRCSRRMSPFDPSRLGTVPGSRVAVDVVKHHNGYGMAQAGIVGMVKGLKRENVPRVRANGGMPSVDGGV